MKIDTMGLSRKAIQLATDRPLVWEHQLAAQVIIDKTTLIQKKFGQGYRANDIEPEKVEFVQIPDWILDRNNEFLNMVLELQTLIDTGSRDVFGSLGQPNDAESVVAFSFAIVKCYYQALSWAQTVRRTPIDSRYAEIPHEVAALATGIITGIDHFGPDLLQQIDNAINAPIDDPQTVTVVLKIVPHNRDRLNKAIDRISDEIRNYPKDINPINTKAGYLYLLINPSMEGVVKIGKTTRNPHERAKELGSVTGIPTPFILVYDEFVDDCDEAEKFVHTRLEVSRVASNREFFRVRTNEAVKVILEAKKLVANH